MADLFSTTDVSFNNTEDYEVFFIRERFGNSYPLKFLFLYGGFHLLLWLLYMLLTPYFYFRYERQEAIKQKQKEREKLRRKPVIWMPSKHIDGIKAILMSQSKSNRKLSKWKRSKLESFRIVCFCGTRLRKGTPAQILDDVHSKKAGTDCYSCSVCDRSLHFEDHKHLSMTCPQGVGPLHSQGFVLCIYCVWTGYVHQKNMRYYKSFVQHDDGENHHHQQHNNHSQYIHHGLTAALPPPHRHHQPVLNGKSEPLKIGDDAVGPFTRWGARRRHHQIKKVMTMSSMPSDQDDDMSDSSDPDEDESDADSVSLDSFHRDEADRRELNRSHSYNSSRSVSRRTSARESAGKQSSNVTTPLPSNAASLIDDEIEDRNTLMLDDSMHVGGEVSVDSTIQWNADIMKPLPNEAADGVIDSSYNTIHSLKEQFTLKKKKKGSSAKDQIQKIKDDIKALRAQRFTFKRWRSEIWRSKHLYLAVLLHVLDTATDMTVLIMVSEGAWNEATENWEVEGMHARGTWMCVFGMIILYRVASAITIWTQNRTNHHLNRWRRSKAVLQLADWTIFWELYSSHFADKKTGNFLLISKLKVMLQACFLSVLQSFVFIRLSLGSSFSREDEPMVSLSGNKIQAEGVVAFSAVLCWISILYRFNLEDAAVFKAEANKKWPPSFGYLMRALFRFCEILSRLYVLTLICVVMGERFFFVYFALDLMVNLRLYRKGLIGPTWMNIFGYILCVVDLASVPSPAKLPDRHKDSKRKQESFRIKQNTLKNQNNSPEDALHSMHRVNSSRSKNRSLCHRLIVAPIWFLFRSICNILTVMFGFFIPYMIGCCNGYLDQFGFVMVTSRLWQHSIILSILYIMLVEDWLDCDNVGGPDWVSTLIKCASREVKEGTEELARPLIIIAGVLSIFTFMLYLASSKYLKVGVIATERNPWLAVRVGDIADAITIFKENQEDVTSHEWRRKFWRKFVSSKYAIPDLRKENNLKLENDDLKALYDLLRNEDGEGWDLPLIKDIAFEAVEARFGEVFELFFHPHYMEKNDGVSPFLNPYTAIDDKGDYIMHKAAAVGAADILHLLVTKGRARVPMLNLFGETPLHLAARNGDINTVMMLMNAFSVTTMAKNEKYPIHYAVEAKNDKMVEEFMKYVLRLQKNGYYECSVWSQMIGSLLLSCAQSGNVPMFDFILKAKKDIVPDINYKLKSSGLSTLHYAVLTRKDRRGEIVSRLLKKEREWISEIDMNIKDRDGITPLMCAVRTDDVKIVRKLLSAAPRLKLNVNEQTEKEGSTALHCALYQDKVNKDIVGQLIQFPWTKLLPDTRNKETPLHLATRKGTGYRRDGLCTSMIEMYCDEDRKERDVAVLDQQSRIKETVLHIAARHNDWTLCDVLLRNGANPYLLNAESEMFWEIAEKLGHNEIVHRWKEMEPRLPKGKWKCDENQHNREQDEVVVADPGGMAQYDGEGGGGPGGPGGALVNASEEEIVGEEENKKSLELKRKLIQLARINSSKHRISKYSLHQRSHDVVPGMTRSPDRVSNHRRTYKRMSVLHHDLEIGLLSPEKRLKKKCRDYWWIAVENNDWKIVEVLLKHQMIGVNEFAGTGRFAGQTAMHIVCTLGHMETLVVLTDEEADVNVQSESDWSSPLLLAARFNHVDCVRHLLSSMADTIDVNLMDVDETTPFYEACHTNNVEVIRLLMRSRNDLDYTQQTRGRLPFDIINDPDTVQVVFNLYEESQQRSHTDRSNKAKQMMGDDPFLIHRNITDFEFNKRNEIGSDELASFHPYESQLCKYCDLAMEDWRRDSLCGGQEMFEFLWNQSIAPFLHNPEFRFLHIFCKEGHFDILKYLIFRVYTARLDDVHHDASSSSVSSPTSAASSNELDKLTVNWIVKDEDTKYPIQYLVEWFQYKNKMSRDSEWTLSYVLQRTFNSLMFSKLEDTMWRHFHIGCNCCCRCNERCSIDWNTVIKFQSTWTVDEDEDRKRALSMQRFEEFREGQKQRHLKKRYLRFLVHVNLAMFGLERCPWILRYYHHRNTRGHKKRSVSFAKRENDTDLCVGYLESVEYRENLRVIKDPHFVFNSRLWSDGGNIKAYYHGIRRGDGEYRFPYQFRQIQDLIVYADDLQKGQVPDGAFPVAAFECLCDLILSDSVPLDLLQYLVDLVRNLSALPALHPVLADMVFMGNMLDRICSEMEEHLCRDGSDRNVGHELPLYVLEATAISAVGNCYKFPTVITQKVVEIAIEQLGHSKSPNIRLMASKLIYNLALELRMEMLSTLFVEQTQREFAEDANEQNVAAMADYESYPMKLVTLHDEEEDDSESFDTEDEEDIYGRDVKVGSVKPVPITMDFAMDNFGISHNSLKPNSSKISLVGAVGQLVEMGSLSKKKKSQSVHRQVADYSVDSVLTPTIAALGPLAQEPERNTLRLQTTNSNYSVAEEQKVSDLNDPRGLRSAVEQIERDLAVTFCDEVVARLNEEEDVRVRSQCLQTLGLLLISNGSLLQHVDDQIRSLKEERPRRDYVEYGFWKKMDRECPVNGDLHRDIVYLIRAPLDSVSRAGSSSSADDSEEKMNIQQIPHSLPIFPRLQSDSYRSTSNVNHNPVNSASDLRAKSVSFGDAPNGDEPLSGFEPLDEHAPSNATVITHNQSAHSDRYSELNLPRPSVMQPQKTAYDDDEDYNEDLPIMNLLNSEQPRGSAVPIDPDADGKYDEGFDGDGDSHSDLAVGGGDGDNALFTGNNNRADGRYETNGNGVIQHQDSDQEDDRLRPMGPMSMGTNDISTNQQHHVFSPDVFSPDGSPPGGRTGSGTGIGGKGTVAKYGRMSSQMEGDDEEEDNGLLATNLDIHPTPGHQPVMAFSTVIPRQSLKDRPSGPLLEDQGVNGPLPLMEHTSSAEQAQFENFAMRDIIRLKEKRSRRMKDNVSVSQSLSVNEVGNRISKKMPDSASPALVFVDSKIVDQKENENDSDIDSDDDDDDEEEDGQLMVSHIGIAGDDEPVRFQIPGISQFDNDGDAQLIYDDEEEVEHESDNDVITGDVTAGNQAGQYME